MTMLTKYEIPGVRNAEAGSLKAYTHPYLFAGTHAERFESLKEIIEKWVDEGRSRTIARFGDGDYNYLMRIEKGSAKPGNRGVTVPYDQIDLPLQRFGFIQNDIIALELAYFYRRRYLLYFLMHQLPWNPYWRAQRRENTVAAQERLRYHYDLVRQCLFGPEFTFDVVYSLVASRWIFTKFPEQVGLIGNALKLDLIRSLMEQPEYRRYIGTQTFTDYIGIPQKGAANDADALAESIAPQIQASRAKVFLVGVGHAKSGLLWRLKQYSSAVFIDVGVGLDAIAGCVCQERPFFADWTNYRLKNYDYSKIDQMDYTMDFWDKSKYKTIEL